MNNIVETLELELAELLTARKKLAMGEKVALVSYSAEGANTRQFHQADMGRLDLLILETRQKIARLKGTGGRRLCYI